MGEKIKGNKNKNNLSADLLKEVLYQPEAVSNVLKKHLSGKKIVIDAFGDNAPVFFRNVHRIQIITTAESFHAGMMTKYWLEEIAGVPCQIEIAHDYLLRTKVIESNKLCVMLSETGEEPDLITALEAAKDFGYVAILGISNVSKSTLMHEADLSLMTGYKEMGLVIKLSVAQTFIAQLTGVFLLSIALGRFHRLNELNEKLDRHKDKNKNITEFRNGGVHVEDETGKHQDTPDVFDKVAEILSDLTQPAKL